MAANESSVESRSSLVRPFALEGVECDPDHPDRHAGYGQRIHELLAESSVEH